MKIAILGSRGFPFIYSGYETFVAELAPRLVQRGHEVTVYCHRGLFLEHIPKVRGVKLVYVPAIEKKILSQFTHSFLATIHACFSQNQILLFVNSANGPFGLLTRIAGKHTGINVDGLEWLRPKWRGLGRIYYRLASLLSTRLFDTVISDSVRMAEIYKLEFGADSVTIAYGANIGYSQSPEVLRRWKLTSREYYLVVGRLIPDNNADVIINGFKLFSSKKKLVILGDVPYRDRYAESLREGNDERVMFLGYIKDPDQLRELYCNAFVYLHGHEFGGTNPSLLNALASGCSILALDTPFNREVLADGKFGMYFSKSAQSFCEQIKTLEEDQSIVHRLRELSRSRIYEKYTWDAITDQYESLFKGMIGDR